MVNKIGILLMSAMLLMAFRSGPTAYAIYNAEGQQVDFDTMLDEVSKADVIFFGEYHNNPIIHWMQFELLKSMHERFPGKLILGAEMFEADNQEILNEYLAGITSEKSFEKEARLWPNYKTDYKPLVTLAKENNYPFIATNVPRRYASTVYMSGFEGLEGLSKEAKDWIAPMPFEVDTNLASYKEMMQMGMGHGGMNLLYAQAIKDATMAWNIYRNFEKKHKFIHFNGAFHSDQYEGIVWYLKQMNKKLNVATISCAEVSDPMQWDENSTGVADFVIYVDNDMTKTH